MPVMKPFCSAVNLTPRLTAAESGSLTSVGTAPDDHTVHGHVRTPTVTLTPAAGVSRLPLSSTARLLSVTEPVPLGVQVYVQLARPIAGCHVVPPSTDTSTAPTMPPPVSDAMPAMVTGARGCTIVPAAGEVITDVGAVASDEGDAATSPACRFAGCTDMSAK